MAVRKISPIGKHRTGDASSTRLVDEMLSRYVSWREHAAAVADAYRQWAAAPADEEADGFSAYLAALDLEESSANRYAVLVADVERSLTRDRGQST
jgi:hypothetical protein